MDRETTTVNEQEVEQQEGHQYVDDWRQQQQPQDELSLLMRHTLPLSMHDHPFSLSELLKPVNIELPGLPENL